MINVSRQSTAMISGTWASGGLTTDPSANDILATTGQLQAGEYFISFEMHCTTDTKLVVAHRNAADSADLDDYEVPCPADTTVPIVFPIKITVVQNERFIVRCKSNITGDAQASILFGRVIG